MPNSIVDALKSAGNCKTMSRCIEKSGMASKLSGPGPFTLCCPTDEAFGKLPKDTLDKLLEDAPKLKSIVNNHIISGSVMSDDIKKMTTAKSLEGESLSVNTKTGVKIQGSTVTRADIRCDNGVVHMIDKVIMPSKMAKAA